MQTKLNIFSVHTSVTDHFNAIILIPYKCPLRYHGLKHVPQRSSASMTDRQDIEQVASHLMNNSFFM